MPDREKYIDILSKAVKAVKEYNEETPLHISLECVEDILELLKVQEPVEPELEGGGSSRWWVCGECHTAIDTKATYCRECGRKIKWGN